MKYNLLSFIIPTIMFSADAAMGGMVGGGPVPTDLIDPLNEDLSGVDTSFPLIQQGQVIEFKCTKSEVKQPEDASKSPRWNLTFETLAPCMSQEGQELKAGTKLFESLATRPSGKATIDMVKKFAAIHVKGLRMTGTNLGNLDSMAKTAEGSIARIKVGIRAGDAQYPAKNVILAYV